jgi:hypothetical protein
MPSPSDTDRSDVLYAFTEKLGLQVNLAGTGNNKRIEAARLLLLSDFVVRTLLPLVLQRTGFREEARRLRRLPVVTASTVKEAEMELSAILTEAKQMAPMPREQLRKVAHNLFFNRTAEMQVNCTVDHAQTIQNAVHAGIPYDELLDLVVDVVADAMVIQ